MLEFYIATLRNLRSKWPNAWPGLPVVLNACIQRLWPHKRPAVGSTSHKLLQAALAMASHMEKVALEANYEPLYYVSFDSGTAEKKYCGG